jgi:hypothetical protein
VVFGTPKAKSWSERRHSTEQFRRRCMSRHTARLARPGFVFIDAALRNEYKLLSSSGRDTGAAVPTSPSLLRG